MGKEKDTKINHTVYNIEDVGQVQIADEVVAVIAWSGGNRNRWSCQDVREYYE